MEAFLAGYLTSPRAVTMPLVVLGEPGSGKSKLAQVLAARLPEADFLPVLVELRAVAAESMIQEQIEQAIYAGPGERVSWHDLAEAAGGALPVVILDGFDELIQAAATSRYDYLEQVRDFQHRQAQAGYPVAVIVTSRTVAADQARFPAGTVTVQLQPFTENQIRSWLAVWEHHNAAGLAARGLCPLPAPTALAHGDLARQPLLLLMLALFDAADNSLQRARGPISRADLYERLLTEFARRETSKTPAHRALPAPRQHLLAERELQRLSIVALAMFARGRQSASEAELSHDLRLLFPGDDSSADPDTGLSPAQRAAGRFFFIHRSEARSHGDRARSYEFLHATFGEFLVARLALGALRDLAARREAMQGGMTAAGRLDDGFLFAVLSFACLAVRAPIISFLRELAAHLPRSELAQCRQLLPGLIAGSLYLHPSRSFTTYEPVRSTIPRRLAAYSANLVILLVLTAGQVTTREFTDAADLGGSWAQYGHLWRSALTSTEWDGLTSTIRVRISRSGELAEITLSPEDGLPVSPLDSLIIRPEGSGMTRIDVRIAEHKEISFEAEIPSSSRAGQVFRSLAFLPDWLTALLLLQTVPAIRALGGEVRISTREDAWILPASLLAHLDYQHEARATDRLAIYRICVEAAHDHRFLEQTLLRLYRDVTRIPAEAICDLLDAANLTPPPSRTYVALLNALWRQPGSQTAQPRVIALVSDLHRDNPDDPLLDLDEGLRSAVRL